MDEEKINQELKDEELDNVNGGFGIFGKIFGRKRHFAAVPYITVKPGDITPEIPEGWVKWECPKCSYAIYTPAETTTAPLCPEHKTKCLKVSTSITF